MGCFSDREGDRALPFRLEGNRKSVAECLAGCLVRGYKFAGRQYLGQCWCGNSGYAKHGVSDCNDCSAENVGGYRSCVWEINTGPPAPTLAPGPTPNCRASPGYSPGNHGSSAYFDYDNQNHWPQVTGNTPEKIRWSKFSNKVFDFKLHNQCGYNFQSPINVCDGTTGPKNENAECFEYHKIIQFVSWEYLHRMDNTF